MCNDIFSGGREQKIMKVRYWWTEDGVPEICEQEECVLRESVSCYHCDSIREKGSKMCVLHPICGEDKYVICVECAEKSTKIL